MKLNLLPPAVLNENGYLSLISNDKGEITLKVYNSSGLRAMTLNTSVNADFQSLELNMGDLEHGRYVLNAFIGDKFIQSVHFIK